MNSVIALENIRYRWPGQPVDILVIDDFSIAPGEKVFLYGPSGSGKSTLLNLIGGVLSPNQGRLSVLGQDITALPPQKRDTFRGDHMGFIFQMFNLLPYFSAIENVTLPCEFSRLKKQKAEKAAKSIDAEAVRLLTELEIDPARKVTELSVGQQQRVAMARAMMGSPEVIIADEPTSALDANVRDKFLSLLFAECDRSQSTLIFVSHDLALGEKFDRVFALSDLNSAGGKP